MHGISNMLYPSSLQLPFRRIFKLVVSASSNPLPGISSNCLPSLPRCLLTALARDIIHFSKRCVPMFEPVFYKLHLIILNSHTEKKQWKVHSSPSIHSFVDLCHYHHQPSFSQAREPQPTQPLTYILFSLFWIFSILMHPHWDEWVRPTCSI